ncbi:MAG: hypothetical protein ACE3L7_08540 [Candidatus Pristimantibacillus sp.]
MSNKPLPRNSLLSLGGMFFPIIFHGIHMLLPLLVSGGVGLANSNHSEHVGIRGSSDSMMDGLIIGITVISILFTLWYLYKIWSSKHCSRTVAWCYTAVSILCFVLIGIMF